jgi:hypothetical protein
MHNILVFKDETLCAVVSDAGIVLFIASSIIAGGKSMEHVDAATGVYY